MTISFNIQPTILILLGISFVLTLLFFLYDFIRFKSLKKSLEKSNFLKNQKNKHIEGVSVVIYADNDSTYLNQNLPLILGQDYPLFEVIVVCNGKDESTIDIVEKYAQMHSNLHFSFIPDDARNLSRKKLALMLGIKAAAFDIIITTNGNCSPYTTQWISSIAQHFQNGIDVVIGHSTPIGKGAQLSNYQKFISQENSLKYLSQAIMGKPYRGTSDNLAYRKSIFFDESAKGNAEFLKQKRENKSTRGRFILSFRLLVFIILQYLFYHIHIMLSIIILDIFEKIGCVIRQKRPIGHFKVI